MSDQPAPRPAPDDKVTLEALVADCIEALERGEADPATRVCADRPDLLTRVQRRLAQLASRGLIPDSEALPASIGPYRILKELGSGGMGTVYLAEQLEPVRRHVALKVVKLGMDTREVVARFQAERQALARMNHPHIAQVFDAGITAEGRPYFAMEYVAGSSLTAFCDHRKLTMAQRIRLMATVCRAVQHAHDRGFIHRDLKPSNVLVQSHGGEYVPKIIDFGIAKATAVGGDDGATQPSALRTRADQVLGTPEYMSPEQLCSGGLDVDTRTDVYSLGVTLYELLCGELPFDGMRLRRASRQELERIVLDELPTEPSKRLSQVGGDVVAARGGERTLVQRSVHGELDWITLKALAKQREQRYPSALALAEDLERWLRHEPVAAAPPGRAYRLRKFLRRHRVAVAAVSSVLLALVLGLVVSVHATAVARAAQADTRIFYGLARDAVGNLVGAADERLAEVPQADSVRRQLLADAIGFYRQLRAQQPQDPELRLDLLAATERIGTLQHRLGQSRDALATLQACAQEVLALRADRPDDGRLLMLAVGAHAQLAAVQGALGQADQQQAALRKALELLATARATAAPGDAPALDLREARLLSNLATATAELEPALAGYERALALFAARAGSDPVAGREHARCAALYAEALTRAARLDAAAAALTTAIARMGQVAAATGVAMREDEARVQEQFARVLRRLERRTEARSAQQRAIDLHAALAAEHPDVPAHADAEAAGWHFLAQLLQDEGDPRAALAAIGRAVALRERLASLHPQAHALAVRCVRSLLTRADLELQLWQHHGGERAPAEATLDRALQQAAALQQQHGDDLDVLLTYAAVRAARGAVRTTVQDFAGARQEHEAVRAALRPQLARFDQSPDLHYQLALTGNHLLQAHYLLRDPAAAAAAGEEGVQHLERGLALDARHRALLDLAPALVARLATARFAAGDHEGGFATLLRLCERPAWGPDAREQGALLLANEIDSLEPAGDRHVARAVQELRAALAGRGDLAAALARPAQQGGFSHTGSRLRDFDLRLGLGEMLGKQGDLDAQAAVLAEAVQLDASLPGLDGGRVRNLFAQRAELLLAQLQPAAAAAVVDELIARTGPEGGANYLAAVLYVHALRGSPATAKEALAQKAVACLGRALDHREVPREAALHPNFAALRGRDDYAALLDK